MKTKWNVNVFALAIMAFSTVSSCIQEDTPSVQESDEVELLTTTAASYKGWNPTWANLIGNEPRATTNAEQSALRDKVANGTIDTRGTLVDVPNTTIETTGTGSRSVMPDSDMRWHNPLNSNATDPNESTRWYQKDGNTQVFRVIPGDQNWQNSRVGAARSEAFAPNLGIRRDDNKVMTFSARYHVAAHNGAKDVKIFQSKATAANGFDPAWGVALHVTAAGDIDIIKRGVTWPQNERISTGKTIGQSFNLRVTDDGFNYKVFIDNVEKASGTWDRANLKSVCRWGAYVQGGSDGILPGSVSNPEIVYISGARVTLTN
ncbi:hypothetical protein DN752_23340 [Echinicola strongylocentroti]|uniref:Polysaccharide lyase n=1 Tax=Echinicola strongylocentroti TaxID=1795355 RepID=A0A2Z4IPT2_9BACT|nr:hypothetical protein [Echinicola strongylocentroti]AWW32837.1 hypothetical protein DN752_23340 [Echinicola strongylocentroti]